ncbi:MAG: hypothetical protein A2X32_10015 [Elusimicrobia bacterium GWC2_64_44]|nr:MAG: hypothetical protein A2X32_10015 [Elusimicrobia bacterium GWC2_64_44]
MKTSGILAALLIGMAGKVYSADFADLQAFKPGDIPVVKVSVPFPVAGASLKAFELYCGGGKLQLSVKDARRFNAVVNDAGIASALRSAAAKLPGGEKFLVNVVFTGPSSFMVGDLQKLKDGSGYDAGQFAPKLYLLGGGRAKLVLTYFRMTNSQAYDFREVASFEFQSCGS